MSDIFEPCFSVEAADGIGIPGPSKFWKIEIQDQDVNRLYFS